MRTLAPWLEIIYERSGLKASVLLLKSLGYRLAKPFLIDTLGAEINSQEYTLASLTHKSSSQTLRANTLIQLGKLYSSKKDFERASALFQQALQIAQSIPEVTIEIHAWLSITLMHLKQDQFNQAREASERAVHLAQTAKIDHFAADFLAGWLQTHEHLLPSARELLTRAVRLKPEDLRAHSLLAKVLYRLSLTEEALSEFLIVLKLDPEDYTSYNYLATSYKTLGQLDRATSITREVLAKPLAAADQAWAHMTIADIARLQGRWEEARAEFEQAAELQPNSPAIRIALANVYRRLGQEQERWQQLTLAEQQAEWGNYDRTCLYAARDETEKALEHLKISIEQYEVPTRWMTRDPDLESIWPHPNFKQLIGISDDKPDLQD